MCLLCVTHNLGNVVLVTCSDLGLWSTWRPHAIASDIIILENLDPNGVGHRRVIQGTHEPGRALPHWRGLVTWLHLDTDTILFPHAGRGSASRNHNLPGIH